MTTKRQIQKIYIAGNFIPAIQIVVLLAIGIAGGEWWLRLLAMILWIYFVPPLLARLSHFIQGKPNGEFAEGSAEFWQWYLIAQTQVLYSRFPFLEEILRCIPLFYNNWLRLWGAEIGTMVYWSARVVVMDRPYLKIGDQVQIGYGVGISSHHVNRINGLVTLTLASPVVENFAVLGGLSGLTPGSEVAEGETLPSTMGLAPFYRWQDGRRHSIKRKI